MTALTKALLSYVDSNGDIQPLASDASGFIQINVAAGAGPTTGTITSVNGAASSTQLLAANTSRKGATFFNDSTAILYLALSDTTASTSVYSIQLPAGAYFELPATENGTYTGRIVGIWASATGAVRITELT